MAATLASEMAGLNLSDLIGAPLQAAVKASVICAQSTAQFISEVGFKKDGTIITVPFTFERPVSHPDGTITQQVNKIDAPLLAIVPIPALQVKLITVDFEMEIHNQESSKESNDMEASLTASFGWGPFKVEITGKASSHSESTRSSDTRSKYVIHVEARDEGMPEGLARVLDLLADACAPKEITNKGATLVIPAKAAA